MLEKKAFETFILKMNFLLFHNVYNQFLCLVLTFKKNFLEGYLKEVLTAQIFIPPYKKAKLMTRISFPQVKVVVALTWGTSLQVIKATAEKGLTDSAQKEVTKRRMKMMAQIQKKSTRHLHPHQHLHHPE